MNFGTGTNTRYNTPNSTTYDNGYRLKIEDDLMGSTITLRAGNYDHKWITAHLSDYSSEGGGTFTGEGSDLSTYSYTNTRSSLSGEFDLMPWKDYNTVYEPSENTLFNVIRKGLSSTDFWTQSSLTLSNSGLYNYSVTDQYQQTSIFCSQHNDDNGISFTDVTTIHKAYIVGTAYSNYRKQNNNFYINDDLAVNMPSNDTSYYSLDITDILINNKQLNVIHNSTKRASYYCIIVWS